MITSTKIIKAVTDVAYIAAAAAFILLTANATGSEIENRLASIKK